MQTAISGSERASCTASSAARVLIVEDEMILALALEDMVKELEFQVAGIAGSVEEATKLVDECDVAIVDYNLHGRPADLLAKLLQVRGIPYALATGSSLREMASKLPDALMLPKPYTYNDVQMMLETLLLKRAAAAPFGG